MKTIKILKNLSYIFYSLTGLTPVVFIFISINMDISDSVGAVFTVFGIIFLFSGFVLSHIANKKLKKQSPNLPKEILTNTESKKVAKKMFKIGFFAFIGLGISLVGSLLIFWDGGGDELETPWLISVAIFSLVGVVSWTLATMRYFRK